MVRYGKGEERLYFIGRIEDVQVIYESSTLDERTETIKPPNPYRRVMSKVVSFFVLYSRSGQKKVVQYNLLLNTPSIHSV